MEAKKTAVMYGAGNIGRGFIGQVLHDSGYEVVFIDIAADLIDTFQKEGAYTITVVCGDKEEQKKIENVRGVSGFDLDTVAQEISNADIMAVSVGMRILPRIAGNIAAGLRRRAKEHPGIPLNILICENLPDPEGFVRGILEEALGEEKALLKNTGLVAATIGRMIPPLPPEKRKVCTDIHVEPFCSLPVDADAFCGKIPALSYLEPYTPFSFCEEKKLYIHNMGHALCAYFGAMKGYTYLYESIADPTICFLVRGAMQSSAHAIANAYGENVDAISTYAEDLVHRFGNAALGDTVVRVGKDPLRKLSPKDRLLGGLARCRSQKIPAPQILMGIAAALHFSDPADTSAQELQSALREKGVEAYATENLHLPAEDAREIAWYWRSLPGELGTVL